MGMGIVGLWYRLVFFFWGEGGGGVGIPGVGKWDVHGKRRGFFG